ncbi:MAG: hemerythrin domain-containing protein [Polyangiaceae bacterium]|nr:hemerythrin domain-containing protein [Polyangiaceae bacterium]
MDYDKVLSELFSEEDAARAMARHLMNVANRSTEEAAAERQSLIAFLHGPMERHMEYEERCLFPKLEDRGLLPEVQVARKHHEAIREKRTELEGSGADPTREVAELVFEVARLMLHHTNFEGDYIYPELDNDDWRELMEETMH